MPFAAMARTASSVVEYFNFPANRVIELGTQIEIEPKLASDARRFDS
jgi:K+ transporter